MGQFDHVVDKLIRDLLIAFVVVLLCGFGVGYCVRQAHAHDPIAPEPPVVCALDQDGWIVGPGSKDMAIAILPADGSPGAQMMVKPGSVVKFLSCDTSLPVAEVCNMQALELIYTEEPNQ